MVGAASQAENEAMAGELEEDNSRAAHLLSSSYNSLPLAVGIRSKTPSGCLKLLMVLNPYIYCFFPTYTYL